MILIAGAGFVGARLAEIMSDKGKAFLSLSRSGSDNSEACDICDPSDLATLANKLPPVSQIILSASSGGGGADAYRAVFLEGAQRLLETFSPERLIFTSSTSVYAQSKGELVDETAETAPPRETGQILLQTESLVRDAGGVATRLSGIYGPGRSVILRRYLQGESKIDGNPKDKDVRGRHLNQIHRDDAASALAHLLELEGAAGQTFNVTDSSPMPQRECFEGLDQILGKGVPEVHPPKLGGKRGWSDKQISNAKLCATGWQPRYASYLDAVRTDPDLLPSIEKQLTP